MNFFKKSKFKISNRQFRDIHKRLYNHVNILSNQIGPRNINQYRALDAAQNYISEQMQTFDSSIFVQKYMYDKHEVSNLIVEKKGCRNPDEIIIIGAHYDTVEDSPGADDNATAVAALIELLHLLRNYKNHRTLRFVAFTLEEPPTFGTDKMGSYVYANCCKRKQENIIGMLALEMLGFYSDKEKSQKYPLHGMRGDLKTKGNFAAVVSNGHSSKLANEFAYYLRMASLIDIEKFIVSSYLPGVELSDHSSFWKFEYPAIMITDTAFFRNPNYHEPSDTIETLNFKYFTNLLFSLEYAIKKLDREYL